MSVILRRRKLGKTSVREICAQSRTGIVGVLDGRDEWPNPLSGFVFRWGCTADVPHRKVTIVNEARAIHKVANKAEFRKELSATGLAVPSWTNHAEWLTARPRTFPVVVRPTNHHQGRNLVVCNTIEEVLAATTRFRASHDGYYISNFFDKDAEFRVFIVSGRAVAVARKTPANPRAVAWNVAQGGRFDNVRFDDWDVSAVKRAIEAFNLSGLDFGGVDIMKNSRANLENRYCVLEINSAPSLTSPYRQACMAKAFDYINEHGKAHIPLQEGRGGYRKFIHPAIINDATD